MLDRYASKRTGCFGSISNDRLDEIDRAIEKSISEDYREQFSVVARRKDDDNSYLFLYTKEFINNRAPLGRIIS